MTNENLIRTILESGKDNFSKEEIMDMLITTERTALSSHNITIEPKSQVIIINNKIYKVARKIFELAYYLLKNKNQIINKKKIMIDVWGNNIIVNHRTVDVHIRWLRKIIGDPIKTVRGNGYGWMEQGPTELLRKHYLSQEMHKQEIIDAVAFGNSYKEYCTNIDEYAEIYYNHYFLTNKTK
jgi:DNA-binding winged helix-turn-helix (wHTH) protein